MRGVRGIVMLGLSAAAGLAAVTLVGQPSGPMPVTPKVVGPTIVIASQDLPMGQLLDASMLRTVDWSSGDVPEGAFKDKSQLEGRVIKATLSRGEAVLAAKLAPVGSVGGLSALIGAGNRAITVKVNEVVGVAGFALPGNYVDVIVSTQDEHQKAISKIVLERILVLAIAQQEQRSETAPRVVDAVTLEVTPEQAERLDLARSVGSLSLVLRNQVDDIAAATSGARKNDLIGTPALTEAKPAPRAVARSRPQPAPEAKVEVIRGVQRTDTAL